MTHLTNLLLLFVTFGSALSSPVNQEDFKQIQTRILEASVIGKNDLEEVNENIIDTNNNPNQCPSNSQGQDGTSNCSSDNPETTSEIEERPSTFSMLRTQIEPSYTEEPESSPDDSGSYVYVQAAIPSPLDWTRLPDIYQANPAILEALRLGVGNYGGALYPHVHPKVFAAMNQGFNINSLPPVRSTYIHGTYGPRLRQTSYDDVLNPHNIGDLSPNVRPVRMMRSAEDDFLAQLQHDAIMNNFIPTMQVRYASPQQMPYLPAVSGEPALAVFPHAAYSSCSQPILLSCTPKITRGVLVQQPVSESVQLQAAAAQHAYRQQGQQDEHIHKNVIDHSEPVKEAKSKLKKIANGSSK